MKVIALTSDSDETVIISWSIPRLSAAIQTDLAPVTILPIAAALKFTFGKTPMIEFCVTPGKGLVGWSPTTGLVAHQAFFCCDNATDDTTGLSVVLLRCIIDVNML